MGVLRRFYKVSPRLRRVGRRAKNAAISGVADLALWYAGRRSLDEALRLGERAGALVYRVMRKPRRLALEHIRLAFGDTVSANGREHLARASFINAARCFCELAKIDDVRARADEYFETAGWEHIQAALAAGRGAVVVTGHIGNWELLAAYCAWRGLPVVAIARRIYAERLNRLLVDFRSRQGVETILRESPSSARQILRAMKANTLLAMLIDQDTHVQSISVPFFGRQARTPAAAASLAIRRDLPVLAVFIQRRAGGGHRITFSPPFPVARTGDVRADIRALTAQFNAAIETHIRQNPAEWVWWHRRWRRAPMTHLDLDSGFQYTVEDTVLPGREEGG